MALREVTLSPLDAASGHTYLFTPPFVFWRNRCHYQFFSTVIPMTRPVSG